MLTYLFLCLLAYAVYQRKPLYSRYQQVKTFLSVLSKLFYAVYKRDLANLTNDRNRFVVNSDTKACAKILYTYNGIERNLYVPYESSKVAEMSQYIVQLYYANGTTLDITQQPGVPYLVTAALLGGKEIRATEVNSEIVTVYEGNTTPLYLHT